MKIKICSRNDSFDSIVLWTMKVKESIIKFQKVSMLLIIWNIRIQEADIHLKI